MDEQESLTDLEVDQPPKLTFEEVKQQIFLEPGLIKEKKDILKAVFYYCKDTKKHSRIIKYLFWPLIISFVQEGSNNKVSLFGLRLLNMLIANEATHEQILQMGQTKQVNEQHQIFQRSLVEQKFNNNDPNNPDGGLGDSMAYSDAGMGDIGSTRRGQQQQMQKKSNIQILKERIARAQNPIKILVTKIITTDSTLIMNEATKALKTFAKRQDVIHTLWQDGELLKILDQKFIDQADPQSQENFLETLALSCKYEPYRDILIQHDGVIEILLDQIKSMAPRVTLFALRILRFLSMDMRNLERLQDGKNLRLTSQLIYTFNWLFSKNNQHDDIMGRARAISRSSSSIDVSIETVENLDNVDQNSPEWQFIQESNLIFREISKTFSYMLLHYDLMQKLIQQNEEEIRNQSMILKEKQDLLPDGEVLAEEDMVMPNLITENSLIVTLINLGLATSDPKTMVNSATSIAHMTEILYCNPAVASKQARNFMMKMLKDSKNMKGHRQACRYFANLSFYKTYTDALLENRIVAYMLNDIEKDQSNYDEETIKYSVIALSNLSSHPNFMHDQGSAKKDTAQQAKVARSKIKPLIHLLDLNSQKDIQIIQSACITLCNMASKPNLQKHFVEEPELSTLKNCFQSCVYFNENYSIMQLLRSMVKIVCNLAKTSSIVPFLVKKGFMDTLIEMLNQDRQREIFGNLVMAVAYLSVAPESQERIIQAHVIARFVVPLSQCSEIDQKLIMIAITTMLYNGIALQREFIKNKGLEALLHLLRKGDIMYQQLSARCFALLSENQEFLQAILDQDCLNIIIIQCIKGNKDIIDQDTMMEILKIFLNIVLWRKIKKDLIQVCCYVCDIGLMIDNKTINVMSLFCLTELSENHNSHKFIFNTVNPTNKDGDTEIVRQISIQDYESPNHIDQNTRYTLFHRMNLFIEQYRPDYYEGFDDSQSYLKHLLQTHGNHALMKLNENEMMMNLITTFYMNLARKHDNVLVLLGMRTFEHVSIMVKKYIEHKENMIEAAKNAAKSSLPIAQSSTTQVEEQTFETNLVCYGNSILSRLMISEQAKQICLKENGHQIILNILKRPKLFNFLQLETLDSLRHFLSDPTYLQYFREIPKYAVFTSNPEDDENLGYLQVLALLSFDKGTHSIFFQDQIVLKLVQSGLFKILISHLKNERDYMNHPQQTPNSRPKPWLSVKGPIGSEREDIDNDNPVKNKNQDKKKHLSQRQFERYSEITLSIATMMANLSQNSEFLREIVGYKQNQLKMQIASKIQVQLFGHETEDFFGNQMHPEDEILNRLKNQENKFIRDGPRRVQKFFNLVSTRSPMIKEQMSIVLANVVSSGDKEFHLEQLTDHCISTLVRIMRAHKDEEEGKRVTDSATLAAVMTILNFTSTISKDLTDGLIQKGFLSNCESLIEDANVCFEVKTVCLLTVSNMYINHYHERTGNNIEVLPATKTYGLTVIKYWDNILKKGEHPEQVRNLIYSSLVMWFNLTFMRKFGSKTAATLREIEIYVDLLSENIVEAYGDDSLIARMLLQYFTLLITDEETSSFILLNEVLIAYLFRKLLSPKAIEHYSLQGIDDNDFKIDPRLIYLSSEALRSIVERIEEDTCSILRKKLQEMNNFDLVLKCIDDLFQNHQGLHTGADAHKQMNVVLEPFLAFIDGIVQHPLTKDHVDCDSIYDSLVALINEKINLKNRSALISIVFNLDLKLTEQKNQSREFIKQLYRTYQDYEKENTSTILTQSQRENLQRKIIGLAGSASTNEENHKALIQIGFFTQFKKNLNAANAQIVDGHQKIELYGILNIIKNEKYLNSVWRDLRHIYKIVFRNKNVIDFNTKVDLFTGVSSYLARLDRQRAFMAANGIIRQKSNQSENGEDKQMISSQKAMVYCLMKCIKELLGKNRKDTNFLKMKYLLQAIRFATKDLVEQRSIFLKMSVLKEVIYYILSSEFRFKDQFDPQTDAELYDTDDILLNYTLKKLCCEIIFNLQHEKGFFQIDKISDCLQMVIRFVMSTFVIDSKEEKSFLILSTLKMISHLIVYGQNMPDISNRIQMIEALYLIKESILFNHISMSGVNIESLLCITNMMNIKNIALLPQMIEMQHETFATYYFTVYLMFNNQLELEETMINYLWALSQYPDPYIYLLRDKIPMILNIMDMHTKEQDATVHNNHHTCIQCRERIFSTLLNMIEASPDETCSLIDPNQVLIIVNQVLTQVSRNSFHRERIIEISMMILIHFVQTDQFNNSTELAVISEIFSQLANCYEGMKHLAKQNSLRFVNILAKSWDTNTVELYIQNFYSVLFKFIICTEQVSEYYLIFELLEIISNSKKTLLFIATKHAPLLLAALKQVLERTLTLLNMDFPVFGVLLFLKRLSKVPISHEQILQSGIIDTVFALITFPKFIESINQRSETQKYLIYQGFEASIKMYHHLSVSEKFTYDAKIEFEGTFMKYIMKIVNQLEMTFSFYRQQKLPCLTVFEATLRLQVIQLLIAFSSTFPSIEFTELDLSMLVQYDQYLIIKVVENLKPVTDENFEAAAQELTIQKGTIDGQSLSRFMKKALSNIDQILQFVPLPEEPDIIDFQQTKELFHCLIDQISIIMNSQKKISLSPRVWLMVLKISSKLKNLEQYFDEYTYSEHIVAVFSVLNQAHRELNQMLATCYFMQTFIALVKSIDNNQLFMSISSYVEIFHSIVKCFKDNIMVVNEPLTMETVLIMIEYWQVLSFYTLTHEHLIEHNVVKLMIESLEKHTHPVMTKAIAGVLFSFGDLKSFSDQFTQEGSIEIILSMVILNQFHYDADIMIRLQETVRVMINQANVKSKFQIAQFGLEIASEMPQPQQQNGIEMVSAHVNEFDNAVQFLHIHIYNILFKEPIQTKNPLLITLLETLLTYERSVEFRKLGLQAVHSIANSLAESETPDSHLQLLMSDRIVSHIFERHIMKYTTLGRERDMENMKLRSVAIDVMVTILEVASSLINTPINKDHAVNNFIEKLYSEYQLFDILIKNIIAETGVVKININEFRLTARALSLMPQHVYELLNPTVLNKPMPRHKQEQSAVSIENFIKAVQIMVKTLSQSQNEQDQIATYFALYAMFMFMSKALKNDEVNKRNMDSLAHENSTINQIVQKRPDNRYEQMSATILADCLVKTQLIQTIMNLAMQSQNVDILRISLKMIVLMIKYQSTELFSREPPKYDASIPNSVQMELEREKDRNRGLFLEVIENMHSLEANSPFLGDSFLSVDYACQMSLLSNLIYSEIKSAKSLNLTPMSNVQIRLLPSVASLVDLVIYGSQQMSSIQLDKDSPDLSKSHIYRYFFYCFTISAALPDILALTRNDSHQHKVLHHEIFKALSTMLQQLQDKKFNDMIDEDIIQQNIKIQDQFQIIQNQPEYLETTNASIIGVSVGVTPSPAKPAYVKSLLEQGESTSVALIRMITTNMQMIATDDFKFRQLERRKSVLSSTRAKQFKQQDTGVTQQSNKQPEFLNLKANEQLFAAMLRLLKEYENYGDVVEGIYDILHIFVQISKALGVDSGDALVSMLDGNKELLGIAIKHTSIYDCEHAYTFLHDLIRASKRYQKGRLRLEKELSYLKPPLKGAGAMPQKNTRK